jgi:hypothetical protein
MLAVFCHKLREKNEERDAKRGQGRTGKVNQN